MTKEISTADLGFCLTHPIPLAHFVQNSSRCQGVYGEQEGSTCTLKISLKYKSVHLHISELDREW